MNPALIELFEDYSKHVVLTVILNGQTTISNDFVMQTMLETYNMGLQVGTKAIEPERVVPITVDQLVPALPGEAPAEPFNSPLSLDQGIVN